MLFFRRVRYERAMWWLDLKTNLTDAIGLSRDALHLLTGVGVQTLLVLVFRSWFGAFWPLVPIALLGLGNEWLDLTEEVWPGDDRALQWWESAKDMVMTLLLPVAIVMLARMAPERFNRPAPSERPAADPPTELPSPPNPF